jgi:hypothetical protein
VKIIAGDVVVPGKIKGCETERIRGQPASFSPEDLIRNAIIFMA